MAVQHIPAPLRALTEGHARVSVAGATLAEALEALEALHPGTWARLVQGERIRPGLAVFVDGQLPLTGLRTPLQPDSEVYFAPAVAGGAASQIDLRLARRAEIA
jgi:molybdopterin synthase sulfur carrier subunit